MRFKVLYLFVFSYLCISSMFLNLVLNQIGFSPLDEIAHFDFIDQLSAGYYSKSSDKISDFTYSLIQNSIYDQYKGKKRSDMGIAEYSYESHQFPLYYLVFASFNFLLKMNVTTFELIKYLRLIQGVVIILAGLLIFRYRLIRNKRLNCIFIGFLAILYILFNWSSRSALNPDNFSLAISPIILYFLLSRKNSGLETSVLFATFIKLINLLILPFYIIFKYHRGLGLLSFFVKYFLLTFILYGFLAVHNSPIDPFGRRFVSELFYLVTNVESSKEFYLNLLRSFAENEFIPYSYFLLVWVFSIFVTLYYLAVGKEKIVFPVNFIAFVSLCIILYISVLATLLNIFVLHVNWYSFRHYNLFFIYWIYPIPYSFYMLFRRGMLNREMYLSLNEKLKYKLSINKKDLSLY